MADLNAAFDQRWDTRHRGTDSDPSSAKRRAVDQFHGMLQWPQPLCQPFRDLLAHRKLIPYLNTLLGRGWRMDHSPVMLTAEAGFAGAHGGGMSVHGSTQHLFRDGAYYVYRNGQMRSGMLVCSFQLADIARGDGGFGVVPCAPSLPHPTTPAPSRDLSAFLAVTSRRIWSV